MAKSIFTLIVVVCISIFSQGVECKNGLADDLYRSYEFLLKNPQSPRDSFLKTIAALEKSYKDALDKQSVNEKLFVGAKLGLLCFLAHGVKSDLETAVRSLNVYTTNCQHKADLIKGLELLKQADQILKKSIEVSKLNSYTNNKDEKRIYEDHPPPGNVWSQGEKAMGKPWSRGQAAKSFVQSKTYTSSGNPFWDNLDENKTALGNTGKIVTDTLKSLIPEKSGDGVNRPRIGQSPGIDETLVKNVDANVQGDNVAISDKANSIQTNVQVEGTDKKSIEDGAVNHEQQETQLAALSPRSPLSEPKKMDVPILEKFYTVVIDPGHGGKDPGAVSSNAIIKEKDITLALAKRMKAMLSESPEIKVILTREDDVHLTLEERPALANSLSADLFISIHCNATNDSFSKGIETYVLSKADSKKVMRVAARENGISISKMNDLQATLLDLLVASKKNESEKLATSVSEAFLKIVPKSRNRGIKQGPFYVLLGAKMPAILVECAFLSNERETRKLMDSHYLDKIANSLSQGAFNYLKQLNIGN